MTIRLQYVGTWVASSQLWDDQEADVALWDSLTLTGSAGK